MTDESKNFGYAALLLSARAARVLDHGCRRQVKRDLGYVDADAEAIIASWATVWVLISRTSSIAARVIAIERRHRRITHNAPLARGGRGPLQ